MLCLNCGKDIGEKIGLCENCETAGPDAFAEADSGKEEPAKEESVEAEASAEEEAEAEKVEEAAAPKEKKKQAEPKTASASGTRAKEGKTSESSKTPAKLPIILAGVVMLLLLLVVLLFLGIGSEQSVEPTPAPETEEDATEASSTPEPDAETKGDAQTFPTAPHFVNGNMLIGGTRLSYQDMVLLYYPFSGRFEAGFYAAGLTPAQKEQTLQFASLREASEDVKPDVLFELFSQPGFGLCASSSVSSIQAFVTKPGATEKLSTEIPLQGVGGLTDFSCQTEMGAPFSIGFSQSTTIDGAELRWELNGSGPLYVSQRPSRLHFDGAGYWPMGMWNKEEGVLSIGFYRQRLSAEQRETIRGAKDLLAAADARPDLFLTFEILDGFEAFRRDGLRSYGIHFVRSEELDKKANSFPGDSDVVSFYEVVSSEPNDALQTVSGQLFEAESVTAQLKNVVSKEIEGMPAQFSWELKFSAPIIDVDSEPVSSVVFDPELAQIDRSVPDASGGKIEAGKAATKLVDAIALFYPAEANLVIGMYSEPLTDEERSTIIRNKGVWQRSAVQPPKLVLSIDLARGTTSLMRSSINTIRLTFVRDPLGDFYFPGSLDRATVKRLAAEISDSDLTHLSGIAEAGGSIALRYNGSYVSEKSGLTFAWKLAIREAITAIE